MTTYQQFKDFLPVFQLLASKRVKNHVKCALVDCPELHHVLCLTALNTLKGRIKVTRSQRQRMLRYKQTLKKLATKSCTRKTKTKLIQKGGGPFLAALLGPAISALASLIRPS